MYLVRLGAPVTKLAIAATRLVAPVQAAELYVQNGNAVRQADHFGI